MSCNIREPLNIEGYETMVICSDAGRYGFYGKGGGGLRRRMMQLLRNSDPRK